MNVSFVAVALKFYADLPNGVNRAWFTNVVVSPCGTAAFVCGLQLYCQLANSVVEVRCNALRQYWLRSTAAVVFSARPSLRRRRRPLTLACPLPPPRSPRCWVTFVFLPAGAAGKPRRWSVSQSLALLAHSLWLRASYRPVCPPSAALPSPPPQNRQNAPARRAHVSFVLCTCVVQNGRRVAPLCIGFSLVKRCEANWPLFLLSRGSKVGCVTSTGLYQYI